MVSPETATSLSNVASVHIGLGKATEAEQLLQRALSLHEQHLGSDHPGTAVSLTNLATVYLMQGKYATAEPLSQHAWLIYKQYFGQDHPQTQLIAENYFFLLQAMERGEEVDSENSKNTDDGR